jgi:hypothetical protein
MALPILTLPLFFSGIAFSAGLKTVASVPPALAANLSGAVVGGLLEYNSMQFGFRSLYIIAALLYVLGWVLFRSRHRRTFLSGTRFSDPVGRADRTLESSHQFVD